MRYTNRLTLTLILLATLLILSTVNDTTHAHQCGLPSPQSEQLSSLIYWSELALQFERDSWNQTAEWYTANGTHSGAYLGQIMTRLQQLADGTDASEWQAIGVNQ